MSLTDPEAAQRKALHERARHRFRTRLGLLAIFISGLILSGLMYFETTALAPGRAALVLRAGELQRVVVDAGRVWRIPIVDRIVQVDLQPQPLPTLRHGVKGSDGGRFTVELRATWQVTDAAAYWRSTKAKPEVAAQVIEAELLRGLLLVASGLPVSAGWGTETREALARAIEAQIAPALKRAGLTLNDLRVISVQTIR